MINDEWDGWISFIPRSTRNHVLRSQPAARNLMHLGRWFQDHLDSWRVWHSYIHFWRIPTPCTNHGLVLLSVSNAKMSQREDSMGRRLFARAATGCQVRNARSIANIPASRKGKSILKARARSYASGHKRRCCSFPSSHNMMIT